MEESYVDLAENLAGSGVKVGKFRADGDGKECAKSELGWEASPNTLLSPNTLPGRLSII
jgi:adenylyl-sulfate reductase (glutathione)